jgi:hypothetical protein
MPLSLTMVLGRPHWWIISSSSRAARRREIEVSAKSARHSRVQSSTTARIPAVSQLVVDEVQAPALVGGQRYLDQPPRSDRSTAGR